MLSYLDETIFTFLLSVGFLFFFFFIVWKICIHNDFGFAFYQCNIYLKINYRIMCVFAFTIGRIIFNVAFTILCMFAVLGNRLWIGKSLQWSHCTSGCCNIWRTLCTRKFWQGRVEGIYSVSPSFFFSSFFFLQLLFFKVIIMNLWEQFLIECFHLAEQSYRQRQLPELFRVSAWSTRAYQWFLLKVTWYVWTGCIWHYAIYTK